MIRPDEPTGWGGGPSDPLQAVLAAALIVAISLLGISLGHNDGLRDPQHHWLRDPAIHRYAPNVTTQQPADDVPEETACPEPEPPLLC